MTIDARMPTRQQIAEAIAQRDGEYANAEDYLEDADRVLALGDTRLHEALAKAEAEIADLQQDRDKWREAKLAVEVEWYEVVYKAVKMRAKAEAEQEQYCMERNMARNRVFEVDVLLAEACEILESYVLLGSRKAKDFLTKVKHQEESNLKRLQKERNEAVEILVKIAFFHRQINGQDAMLDWIHQAEDFILRLQK